MMLDRRRVDDFFRYLGRISFWLSLFAVIIIIYEHGFDHEILTPPDFQNFYLAVIIVGVIFIGGRFLSIKERPSRKVIPVDILLGLYLVAIIAGAAGLEWMEFFDYRIHKYLGLFLVFMRESSTLKFTPSLQLLNPAQLFVALYVMIIILGTVLLMMPNATYEGITFTDALFTSTSAFCITGLIVVDTGTWFTTFGQVVILLLIQLGGIGIMTFTSFFRYLFSGETTYGDQLLLKDITSSDQLTEVFRTIRIIIIFTLVIEAFGAIFIYMSLDGTLFGSLEERIYFSVFHSISGFCSAGFTIMTDSLYHNAFRFNYSLHLIIAFLFIAGGLGFPIIFNFVRYLKNLLRNRMLNERRIHIPWVLNITTRIVLVATVILLVSGTLLFYFFEYDNTLAAHDGAGKIITAFFGAATPRSAGFNTVDTSALALPTVMMVMLFMWIGAGPGSTGGGIKVTSFAVAVMNVVSMARGKDRIEVYGREISQATVGRAFAFMLLSFLMIGASVFLITIIEREQDLLPVAFECFSAYGTVGLSMGITGELENASKLIIVVNMFTGRLGMLIILYSLLKNVKHLNYRYPAEGVLIN